MLIEQLRKDALVARKKGDAVVASLLVTLVSEAAMVGKNADNRESTDEEVQSVIRKFLKNNKEAASVIRDASRLAVLQEEARILESYLPSMAAEAEVKAVIADAVASLENKSPKSMGLVMAALKKRFGANLDNAAASAWVREALN